jgi:uncharacterized protein with HEPN domain
MTEHDDRLPMHQMLEHAREAVEMIRGRTQMELQTNRMFQLALVHLVQIVGEAATRVSPAGRVQYSEIPWGKAITTRHRMVHDYDRIALRRRLGHDRRGLPPLVAALERALAGDSS